MNSYIIGLVASDGHVGKYRWQISQSHESVDVLYKIMKMYGGVLKQQNSGDGSYSTKMKYNLFFKKEKVNPFQVWGVPEGNKTYKLAFPKNKRDEDIWLYLRGFFEGDGSISIEKSRYPRIQIISNLNWCVGCMEFVNSFGIKCYIHNDKRHENIGSVIIHTINSAHLFFEKIYEDPIPLFMNRKYYRWLEIKSLCPKIIEKKAFKKLSLQDIENIKSKLLLGACLKDVVLEYGHEIKLSEIYKSVKVLKEIEIEKLLKQGKTKEYLKNLGFERILLNKVFKKIKKEINSRQGIPISEDLRLKIIEQLKAGKSTGEISSLYQISGNTVSKIKRAVLGDFKSLQLEKEKFVKNLISMGLGRNEIYRTYHISKSLIKKVKDKILWEH